LKHLDLQVVAFFFATHLGDVLAGQENKLLRAVVITVTPQKFKDTEDNYERAEDNDDVITKAAIDKALTRVDNIFDGQPDLIIVRCQHEQYLDRPYHNYGDNPPYYTYEAMASLKDYATHHACTLPSLERAREGGLMRNHRYFFNAPEDKIGKHCYDEQGKLKPEHKRLNIEMCYVPPQVEDGCGFVRLSTPHHWQLDATSCTLTYYSAKPVSEQEIMQKLCS